MGRLVRSTVAPQRVLDQPFDLDEFPRWGSRKDARLANPYKVGDVVWSRAGRRALVYVTMVQRINENDPISDLLPVVRAQEETVKGTWAKQWVQLWPGDLERGFEKWKEAQNG